MNNRTGIFRSVRVSFRSGARATHGRLLHGLRFAIACFLISSPPALAAMAPKYERIERLAAALDHLSEIAHLLDEPIDHIDITQDEVRFFAGRCYVAAAVRNVTLPQGPVGRTPYAAEVGKVHCT